MTIPSSRSLIFKVKSTGNELTFILRTSSEDFGLLRESTKMIVSTSKIPALRGQKSHAYISEKVGRYIVCIWGYQFYLPVWTTVLSRKLHVNLLVYVFWSSSVLFDNIRWSSEIFEKYSETFIWRSDNFWRIFENLRKGRKYSGNCQERCYTLWEYSGTPL